MDQKTALHDRSSPFFFFFLSMVAVKLECDDDISKTDQLGETICLFSKQRDQILERVAVIDHVACLIRGRGEVPTQIRLQPTDYSTRLGPSCATSGKSVDDSHHIHLIWKRPLQEHYGLDSGLQRGIYHIAIGRHAAEKGAKVVVTIRIFNKLNC